MNFLSKKVHKISKSIKTKEKEEIETTSMLHHHKDDIVEDEEGSMSGKFYLLRFTVHLHCFKIKLT